MVHKELGVLPIVSGIRVVVVIVFDVPLLQCRLGLVHNVSAWRGPSSPFQLFVLASGLVRSLCSFGGMLGARLTLFLRVH